MERTPAELHTCDILIKTAYSNWNERQLFRCHFKYISREKYKNLKQHRAGLKIHFTGRRNIGKTWSI